MNESPTQRARAIFRAGDDGAYRRWRDAKLAAAPASRDELLVEVRDPRDPTAAELAAIVRSCRRANMAIYASRIPDEDKALPRQLGRRLGLHALDANLLADDDAITAIRVDPGKAGAGFIPYTDRPIRWHTDGYYNEPAKRIRAMILHCVRSAGSGGENRVADHEMAYIALRERDSTTGQPLVLFSNPNVPRTMEKGSRENLTIRLSRDGGRTWPVSRPLHRGKSAYSSLVELSDGSIGCLYEGTTPDGRSGIHFARFPLDWLTRTSE